MNLIKQLTISALLILGFLTSNAQLSINGEFRSRGIADHGYFDPALKNTDADFYFDQRTRLNFNYKTEKYTAYISFQDARMWGGDDQASPAGSWGNTATLGIYQAWVDLKLNPNSNIKVGRQVWSYDNMRLLGHRNWITPGLSYDGILYQYKRNSWKFDLGFSYNNDGTPQVLLDNSEWDAVKYKSVNFLRINKQITKRTSLSYISMLTAKTDTSSNNNLATATHGFVLNHNRGKKAEGGFLGTLEAYYQHGTDIKKGSNGLYKGISSWMVVAEAGYRSSNKKMRILVGAELISGHDYSNNDIDYKNTRHSFDLMYSARFIYYGGHMNNFIVQDSYKRGTKGGGYFDPYVKFKYAFNKKNIIELNAYFPQLVTDVRAHTSIDPVTQKPKGAEVDESGNPVYWNGSMGQFIDFAYTHKFSKEVILRAGASYGQISDIKNQMVFGYKDPTNKTLYETGTNYFGWVMLIVKPNFYSSKK